MFVLVRPIHLLNPPNLTIRLVLALRTPRGVRNCLQAHKLILALTTCFSSAVVSMIQDVLKVILITVLSKLERAILKIEAPLLFFVQRAYGHVICNLSMGMRRFCGATGV